MLNTCPICQLSPVGITEAPGSLDSFDISCQRCGNYRINRTISRTDLSKYGPVHLLSGTIRNRYQEGEQLDISERTIKELLDSSAVPKDPIESIDLLLMHIFRKAGKAGEFVRLVQNTDYPLLYAEDPAEFWYYVEKAHELKFIEPAPNDKKNFRISLEGWRRLTKLKGSERQSNQAFVAMWFSPSLDDAWENGFKLALSEARYDPIRIDLTEHNEKICDRILAEIRKSRLVVADFTGQKGGVYFEAGFALGLNIPVIWTCRDTDLKDLHFDTRQYNHISWSNSEDLKKKLINRIEATLPKKPQKTINGHPNTYEATRSK